MANVSVDLVRRMIDYDPATGVFRWKPRTPDMFAAGVVRSAADKCNAWNAKFAGKLCGCVNVAGYWQITIYNKHYYGHRVAYAIMNGEWPTDEIDHVNMSRRDNRWENLREATRSDNGRNKRKKSGLGLKGASWDASRCKWIAQAGINGKSVFLGRYDREDDAHAAYVKFAERHFGAFARSE